MSFSAAMDAETKHSSRVKPRIIIHGGAGNILRKNLPPEAEKAYLQVLKEIVKDANDLLQAPGTTALDIATHAVTQLENNPMFNAGRGAVFTRAGTNELEASVMVSRGSRKRGVGVVRLTKVKNPIKLARKMLLRGEADDGGGAQQHCQISGETMEHLAEDWGLDIVKPSYFWTKKRWEEHRRGLGKTTDAESFKEALRKADEEALSGAAIDQYREEGDLEKNLLVDETSWNGRDYLPQGTVGAVVLDSTGTICVATSTGGLTNKLPGRIGDTPTLGAGFWAEEWTAHPPHYRSAKQTGTHLAFAALFANCFRSILGYSRLQEGDSTDDLHAQPSHRVRAVGMSGTGNGDSFLRINAVRTASAIARFSSTPTNAVSLKSAVTAVAGPDGLLQQSAGDKWRKTGEGEGGIIGIEYDGSSGKGEIVADFNCGGMFRGWIDDDGVAKALVFR